MRTLASIPHGGSEALQQTVVRPLQMKVQVPLPLQRHPQLGYLGSLVGPFDHCLVVLHAHIRQVACTQGQLQLEFV